MGGCAVINCKTTNTRDKKSLHALPSDLSKQKAIGDKTRELAALRRQRWLLAVRRADLTEENYKYMRICQDHFICGKPAPLHDTKHPDWVPCINLGYGNTSDPKYIQHLKEKVQKHVESAKASVNFPNVTFHDPLYSNATFHDPFAGTNRSQYAGDANSDTKAHRNSMDKQIANVTNGNKNDCQKKVMIFYNNNNQEASLCYLNKSNTQTNENITRMGKLVCNSSPIFTKNITKLQPTSSVTFKAKAKKSFRPKSYKVPSYSVGVTSSVTDTDDKVPSKNVNVTSTMTGIDDEVSFNVAGVTDIDDQLSFDVSDELDDCNLSTPFLNNLTQLRELNSVSVQTDLKTSDLDHLNNYCMKLKKKLTEANRQIKILTLLLKSSKESNVH